MLILCLGRPVLSILLLLFRNNTSSSYQKDLCCALVLLLVMMALWQHLTEQLIRLEVHSMVEKCTHLVTNLQSHSLKQSNVIRYSQTSSHRHAPTGHTQKVSKIPTTPGDIYWKQHNFESDSSVIILFNMSNTNSP